MKKLFKKYNRIIMVLVVLALLTTSVRLYATQAEKQEVWSEVVETTDVDGNIIRSYVEYGDYEIVTPEDDSTTYSVILEIQRTNSETTVISSTDLVDEEYEVVYTSKDGKVTSETVTFAVDTETTEDAEENGRLLYECKEVPAGTTIEVEKVIVTKADYIVTTEVIEIEVETEESTEVETEEPTEVETEEVTEVETEEATEVETEEVTEVETEEVTEVETEATTEIVIQETVKSEVEEVETGTGADSREKVTEEVEVETATGQVYSEISVEATVEPTEVDDTKVITIEGNPAELIAGETVTVQCASTGGTEEQTEEKVETEEQTEEQTQEKVETEEQTEEKVETEEQTEEKVETEEQTEEQAQEKEETEEQTEEQTQEKEETQEETQETVEQTEEETETEIEENSLTIPNSNENGDDVQSDEVVDDATDEDEVEQEEGSTTVEIACGETDEIIDQLSQVYSDTEFDEAVTFATKTLLVQIEDDATLSENELETTRIDVGDGFYILSFDTEDDTETTYNNLLKNADVLFVEIDTVTSLNPMTAETTVLDSTEVMKELEDVYGFQTYMDTELDGNDKQVTIALIDTPVSTTDTRIQESITVLEEELGIVDATSGNYETHGEMLTELLLTYTTDQIEVLPITAFNNDGNGTVLSAYLGIMSAIEADVDVINLSFAGAGSSSIIQLAIEKANDANIIVIVAAGNNASDVMKYMPANISSAVTVGAVDSTGTIADYSNVGATLDIVAYESYTYNGSEVSGTSVATAYVSAAVALMIQGTEDAQASDIEDKLLTQAIDLGDEGKDSIYGYGQLSLYLVGEGNVLTDESVSVEGDDADLDSELTVAETTSGYSDFELILPTQEETPDASYDITIEIIRSPYGTSNFMNTVTDTYSVKITDVDGNVITQTYNWSTTWTSQSYESAANTLTISGIEAGSTILIENILVQELTEEGEGYTYNSFEYAEIGVFLLLLDDESDLSEDITAQSANPATLTVGETTSLTFGTGEGYVEAYTSSTEDTLQDQEDYVNGASVIWNLINMYNVFSFDDIESTHIVGPIVAADSAYRTRETPVATADSTGVLVASDYSRGVSSYVGDILANKSGSSAFDLNYGVDSIYNTSFVVPALYTELSNGTELYSVGTVDNSQEYVISSEGDSFLSPNNSGRTEILQTDSYIDFDTIDDEVLNASIYILDEGTISQATYPVDEEDINYFDSTIDGSKLTVNAGESWTITNADNLTQIDIVIPDEYDYFMNPYPFPTTISFSCSTINTTYMNGSLVSQFPLVTINGSEYEIEDLGEFTEYNEFGNKIIFNMPYIVTGNDEDPNYNRVVTYANGQNLPGHYIMPQAEFWNYEEGSNGSLSWEGGNINGSIIAKSFHSGNAEMHMWAFDGLAQLGTYYTMVGIKTLNGTTPDQSFEFTLTATEETENLEGFLNSNLPITVSSDEEGMIYFGTLAFNQAETYEFLVEEVIPEGDTLIDYDRTQYKVVIVVEESSDSGFESTTTITQIQGSDGTSTSYDVTEILFNNLSIAQFILPETGGTGQMILYIGSATLILLAILFYNRSMVKIKKRKGTL